MKLKLKLGRKAIALTGVAVATAAIAATVFQLDPSITVTTTDPANNAYKAKMGWISYKSATTQPEYDVKAQIMVYADGMPGKQNIYVARSTDNGATWSQQAVTSNGGAALTGVVSGYLATNNKPNIYVAPIGVINNGKGANALLTWTSTDCTDAGNNVTDIPGPAPAQLINSTLVPNQPYMCLWTARSADGGLNWVKQRLTDGFLDTDEDVPAGFVKYTNDTTATGGFAITYQADPAGLKPGEAEGPGEGASGAAVNPGTNVWYTFLTKAAFEANTPFPLATSVSDNVATGSGAPGASRPNLGISGGKAVLAYEETACSGGSTGKCIVYHNFTYSTPPVLSAGTVVSDPSHNARRVRFLLQGDEALAGLGDAGSGLTKGVHVLMVWRETGLTTPAAASDVMMIRGIKNTVLRAGSTGFLPTDLEPYAVAKNLSDPANANIDDNALAQRGVLRGEFAVIAYDHTDNKTQADLYSDTYNLFITSSNDGGDTWGAPRNMSNITSNAIHVVEPRLVGTPGTIKLPNGTATADPSDIQNADALFVSWGTETNAATSVPQDIFLTRSTDKGVSYETAQRLAGDGGVAVEASEAQLRSPPDGKTLGALWMQRNSTTGVVDVIYRNGAEVTVVPPAVANSGGGGCSAASSRAPFDPVLPFLTGLGLIALGIRRARQARSPL
jgi:hypothetical protein